MIILSHTTALHCFRHFGAEAVSVMPRCSLENLDGPFDGGRRALGRYLDFCTRNEMTPAALHLVFPRGHNPSKNEHVQTHEPRILPPESLVRLSDGIFAVSPELLFCQLSSWGTVYDLAYLAFELCGTYAHPANQRIALADRKTFTTKAKLSSFVEAAGEFSGRKKSREALGLVLDRSASHMESSFAMLLGFPCRLGGLGFPSFKMNWAVPVPKRLRKDMGRAQFTVDLCWPEQKVAFEYDSTEYHSTAEQVAYDNSKRNALLLSGYKVVSFTGSQLSKRSEVDRAAKALAKALGYRCYPRCKDYHAKRIHLEWVVFKDKASVFDPVPNTRSRHLHPCMPAPDGRPIAACARTASR